MIHVRKLMGVAGLGALCAVGLGSTAQAATAGPHTAAAHPQAVTSKYIGNYPTLQLCDLMGGYEHQYEGAMAFSCLSRANGTYDLWAYWD